MTEERPAAAAMPAERPRVQVEPRAQRRAKELGVDLATVTGTGPGGRITQDDVERAAAAPAVTSADSLTPISSTRRLIAERLSAAKREQPHFYLEQDVDVTALLAGRKPGDPSLTVRIAQSAIAALVAHLSVAVDTPHGLLSPVIRNAEALDQAGLERALADLAARARARTLKPDELEGGSFTLSNLGMFGVHRFTAILNPPQAAILAVGAVRRVPVMRGDAIGPGDLIGLTLSVDHRAVDGAQAARFLQTLAQRLSA
jgi:pyruvate dehydrogenase E2 component (dihydrolipoamide acetyltransferase)